MIETADPRVVVRGRGSSRRGEGSARDAPLRGCDAGGLATIPCASVPCLAAFSEVKVTGEGRRASRRVSTVR
jgi:hypothetical protein